MHYLVILRPWRRNEGIDGEPELTARFLCKGPSNHQQKRGGIELSLSTTTMKPILIFYALDDSGKIFHSNKK